MQEAIHWPNQIVNKNYLKVLIQTHSLFMDHQLLISIVRVNIFLEIKKSKQ